MSIAVTSSGSVRGVLRIDHRVSGDTTAVAIDPEFFERGTEYEIDLEVIGDNGNATSTISFFTIVQ